MSDVLYRISGNIGTHENYVFEQLKMLYDSISDEKAKKHVEFFKHINSEETNKNYDVYENQVYE